MIATPRPEAIARTPQQPNGLTLGELVIATGILMAIAVVGIALLLPATRSARPTARRMECQNNIKQIALALLNYTSQNHALPPAYTVDADGKPLHSWRTLILPYLDQKPLYDKIDLTKAWDDPVNAEAFQTKVSVYCCPVAIGPENNATYLAVVTSNSCFHPTEPRRLSEITDDQSQTLMVIEVDADHAVPWMTPRDADESLILALGPKNKLAHSSGMNAAFVDGRTEFLNANLTIDRLRALISIAGSDN
ncbi:MAG: DUF1559 domain-containing protein [Planctomycetaceae bacterium]|nr:DUF1559 domain-containing protein [Planctomycetaceae bacterium]